MRKVTLIALWLWSGWTVVTAPHAAAVVIDSQPGPFDVLLVRPGAVPDVEGAAGSNPADYEHPLPAQGQLDGVIIQLDWHLVLPRRNDPAPTAALPLSLEVGDGQHAPWRRMEQVDLGDIIGAHSPIALSDPGVITQAAARTVAGAGAAADGQPPRDHAMDALWYTLIAAMINGLLEPTAASDDTIAFSILGLGHFVAQWREDSKELIVLDLRGGNLWSFKRPPGAGEHGWNPASAPQEDGLSRTGPTGGVAGTMVHAIVLWAAVAVAAIVAWFRQSMIYLFIVPVPIMLIAALAVLTVADRRRRRRAYRRRR